MSPITDAMVEKSAEAAFNGYYRGVYSWSESRDHEWWERSMRAALESAAPEIRRAAMEEAYAAIRKEIIALQEDTDTKYRHVADADREGKQGAFASGRLTEAKGISRAICEVFSAAAIRALAEKNVTS